MTRAGTVGIIANPAAGKDIRRLVSAASPTSDMAKVGIIRRALVGAVEGGAERVLLGDDHKSLGRQAIEGLDQELEARIEVVAGDVIPSSLHTRRMAAQLRDMGVGAMVVLGGDGTHRDVVKGWRDVAMVPVSTGTNNVFPRMVEATIAGHAAAVVASGRASVEQVARRAEVLDVRGPTVRDDLALVDLALVDARFTASRAVWDMSTVRELLVTCAEPSSIGLSSITARVAPTARSESGGVHAVLGPGTTVRAPVAPGLYTDVDVAQVHRLVVGDSVTLTGPGVLGFDGERDVVLNEGDTVTVTLAADGPWVIDVDAAMEAVAR